MDRRALCLFFTTPLVLLLALGSPAIAQEKQPEPPKEKTAEPTLFCVVQSGPELFEAVAQKDLNKREAAEVKRHKEALKAWVQAQKEARKAKQKFSEPKPKARQFEVVARALKGEEAAAKEIERLLEEIRKAKEKERQKELERKKKSAGKAK